MTEDKIHTPPRPRGFALAASGFPVWFYRLGLGGLLGKRFLMLVHTGRRSGLPRRTVLEVIRYSEAGDAFFVVSAWGERADWYRNIIKIPEVVVHSGRRRMDARADRLSTAEAAAELASYARRYPRAMRIIVERMGYEVVPDEQGFAQLSEVLPVIALKPLAEV
ncbi:MAG: nitroreductase family deazaflavin-dependent oxidoreductase [Anaerolineae bacterium]|nr:nitroreductase family deazaflavin-dependent oxidoreductase [Anaerolineae bacterium]